MKVININEAEKNFDALFEQVIKEIDVKIIQRHDKPAAIIMPLSIYDDLMETLNALQIGY
ncbi:TPA: type II toxin-antitoxin system Phd/YefM family antitoxin [Providencia alcalifaciens]